MTLDLFPRHSAVSHRVVLIARMIELPRVCVPRCENRSRTARNETRAMSKSVLAHELTQFIPIPLLCQHYNYKTVMWNNTWKLNAESTNLELKNENRGKVEVDFCWRAKQRGFLVALLVSDSKAQHEAQWLSTIRLNWVRVVNVVTPGDWWFESGHLCRFGTKTALASWYEGKRHLVNASIYTRSGEVGKDFGRTNHIETLEEHLHPID